MTPRLGTTARRAAVALAVLAVAGPLAADVPHAALAQEPPPELPDLGPSDLDAGRAAAAHGALRRGLDFLAATQAEGVDGSFPGDSELRAPVAVAGLAALAFMAGGSTPDRGPHGAELGRAVDYLLSRVELDPASATRGLVGPPTNRVSAMHEHGYATLALAEAFAMSPRSARGRRLAEAVPAAVDLIERTQGSEGAWWYDPKVDVAHEGSVTICLVQALRSARNAGILVDPEVVARADSYVRRSQHEDGSFRYQLGSDDRTPALTAAAISTLNATGTYSDPAIRRGVDALWRDLGKREVEGGRAAYPYYERLYVAQALWQLGDTSQFERWFEAGLDELLAEQRPDGSWRDRRYGDAYATAMNCIVLGMRDGLLPIFAR